MLNNLPFFKEHMLTRFTIVKFHSFLPTYQLSLGRKYHKDKNEILKRQIYRKMKT